MQRLAAAGTKERRKGEEMEWQRWRGGDGHRQRGREAERWREEEQAKPGNQNQLANVQVDTRWRGREVGN